MDITVTISQVDLDRHNKSEKGDIKKRVCIEEVKHTKLKQFAAVKGVSMQAVVDCFVDKLPE